MLNIGSKILIQDLTKHQKKVYELLSIIVRNLIDGIEDNTFVRAGRLDLSNQMGTVKEIVSSQRT